MALKINLNTPRVKLPNLSSPSFYWENKNKNELGIIHFNTGIFEEVKMTISIDYLESETNLNKNIKLTTYNNLYVIELDKYSIPIENATITITLEGVFSSLIKHTTSSISLYELKDLVTLLCSDNIYCSETLLCSK